MQRRSSRASMKYLEALAGLYNGKVQKYAPFPKVRPLHTGLQNHSLAKTRTHTKSNKISSGDIPNSILCSFYFSHHHAALTEHRGTMVEPCWNPDGTLVEPWWTSGGNLAELGGILVEIISGPVHPGAYLG